jgi:cellobiose-specific phosphotransferase system component IIC
MSTARRSLRQTPLDSRRHAIRRALLCVVLGAATLVVVLLFLEEHRTTYTGWHRITGEENGLVALVTLAFVWLALLAALRFGFASSLLAGIASLLGGLIAAGAMVLVHLLSGVTHNQPGNLALLGCLGLSGLGIAIIIVEFVLRVSQRTDDLHARLESFEAPLPRATVIERS